MLLRAAAIAAAAYSLLLGTSSAAAQTAAGSRPPDGPPSSRIPGFALVETDRTGTMTLFRYRAERPTEVLTEELAALRLTDIQPGLLLQRPRAVHGPG